MADHDEVTLLKNVTLLSSDSSDGSERSALIEVSPPGFHLRPPKPPHENTDNLTPEDQLFQTIHMGPAVVDKTKWQLAVDGLVERPFSISWSQLMQLPKESITAFHECYGSPVKPPDTNLWRIGNVIWAGVPLHLLLELAKPKPDARFVWSDGLDRGSFFEVKNADRYQKDMPISKALTPGCLIAYEMNGKLLTKERGGPVRLIVPGWYGTNSTKWLCRLSLQDKRSKGPFTTIYYNEIDPTDAQKKRKRPCWDVEPNSFLLTTPASKGSLHGPDVKIAGRAWGALGIKEVSVDVCGDGEQWETKATLSLPTRTQFEWQNFETTIQLGPGRYAIRLRATDEAGTTQPDVNRRNHAHVVEVDVK